MTTSGPPRARPAEHDDPLLPPLRSDAPDLPAAADVPPALRIGRVEREATDARLRAALRDDVITITEYDERLGLALRARTQAELDRLVADLPAPAADPATSAAPPLPECAAIVAMMSSEEQRGRWLPARPLRVSATMGSAVVDLTAAVPTDGGFEIDAKAAMGNVEIVVPDDATVTLTGFAVMGEKKNTVAAPARPGGPTVAVNGHAVMGSVQVRTANRRERRRQGHPTAPDEPRSPALAARGAAVRSWAGKAAGVGLLVVLVLGPGRAAVTSDAVAVFGSRQYQPDAAQLAGDDAIDVFSMFGSVEIVIPTTHQARIDVLPIFGSAECEQACETAGGSTVIDVEGTVLFGSTEVRHSGEQPQ